MQFKAIRLCFQNWYLCRAQDIELRDATAFIGPTGAGKSSLQDAIQIVLTGNNHRKAKLNAAAAVKTDRKVIDYCLGYTKAKVDGGVPLRKSCETVLAMVFRAEAPDG